MDSGWNQVSWLMLPEEVLMLLYARAETIPCEAATLPISITVWDKGMRNEVGGTWWVELTLSIRSHESILSGTCTLTEALIH